MAFLRICQHFNLYLLTYVQAKVSYLLNWFSVDICCKPVQSYIKIILSN